MKCVFNFGKRKISFWGVVLNYRSSRCRFVGAVFVMSFKKVVICKIFTGTRRTISFVQKENQVFLEVELLEHERINEIPGWEKIRLSQRAV